MRCPSDWIARSPPWAESIEELQNHSADPLSHEQDVCPGNQFCPSNWQFEKSNPFKRPAWVERWSLESMNRDCWETWASTRQVTIRALGNQRLQWSVSRWCWICCRSPSIRRRTWGWTSWWGSPTSSCRTSVFQTKTIRFDSVKMLLDTILEISRCCFTNTSNCSWIQTCYMQRPCVQSFRCFVEPIL